MKRPTVAVIREREVSEVQRARPEWLAAARKVLAAARTAEEKQRKERHAAVAARRAVFISPDLPAASVEFAREFATANLLHFLYQALGSAAADTYVVDCGYGVSTHARYASETNRERARQGASLSGRDGEVYEEHGGYRAAGTLGDLFDAPTGNTTATY